MSKRLTCALSLCRLKNTHTRTHAQRGRTKIKWIIGRVCAAPVARRPIIGSNFASHYGVRARVHRRFVSHYSPVNWTNRSSSGADDSAASFGLRLARMFVCFESCVALGFATKSRVLLDRRRRRRRRRKSFWGDALLMRAPVHIVLGAGQTGARVCCDTWRWRVATRKCARRPRGGVAAARRGRAAPRRATPEAAGGDGWRFGSLVRGRTRARARMRAYAALCR